MKLMQKRMILLLIFCVFLMLCQPPAVADENGTFLSPIIFSTPEPVKNSFTESVGHDYILQKVSLPQEFIFTRPGKPISPRIVVRNQGGDDENPGNVPVEAWLCDTPLIPVYGDFIPLKGGTSAMYTLRYMIPHDVQEIPCHLTIKIDPWNTRNETGTGSNDMTTAALVSIENKRLSDSIL